MLLDYHEPPEFISVERKDILYANKKRTELANSWYRPRNNLILRVKAIMKNRST